jgi:AbrB family looped-hinge helix DNA binding protein
MAAPNRLTTIISTKGQVILPKSIRDQRRWAAGTRLTVEETSEGVLLKASPIFPRSEIDRVAGSLKRSGRAVTLEEMDDAIAREAKRRARN